MEGFSFLTEKPLPCHSCFRQLKAWRPVFQGGNHDTGGLPKIQGKDMTDIGDIVLVHMEDEPVFYARVEDIAADAKKDWYQVNLRILSPEVDNCITWILKDAYIQGTEFTMQGERIRMEKLPPPSALQKGKKEEGKAKKSAEAGKVISLFDRKG